MLARLAKAALEALLGAAVDAVDRWRRDRALTRLGYGEAQLAARRANDRVRRQAAAIDARPAPGDVHDTLGRL